MYLLEPFNFKNYPWYECTTLYEKSRNFVQMFLLQNSLLFQICATEGGKNLALNVDTNGFEFTNSNCTKIILIYQTRLFLLLTIVYTYIPKIQVFARRF